MAKILILVACFGMALAMPSSKRVSPSLHAGFERYVEMLKLIDSSPLLTAAWKEHMNLRRNIDSRMAHRGFRNTLSLNCPGSLVSDKTPDSVHKLKIGDFNVVGALGDSLTAGNGVRAWTILGCLTEYRGRSWSIGGDSSLANGVTTLPNIMRQFNPALTGFSVASGDENSAGANLNVAVAGNVAQDMPRQADILIRKIQSDSNIDFEKDWKLVTLFIGGNNLCDSCNDLDAHSAGAYIAKIKEALDLLHTQLPRTLVNLVEIFDISPVAQLGNGIICGLVHSSVCGCGHGDGADTDSLTQLAREYQAAVRSLVDSGRYDTRDDFTVVNQPFLRDTVPPSQSNGSPDLSYFAPDCFHFSSKGQNAAGKGLWNSMLKPIGQKNTEWELDAPILCPLTEFIPTRLN